MTREERIFHSMYIPEPNSGCYLWEGPLHNWGYGWFHINGEHHRAHRYAWSLVNGPVPDGLHVLHRCDTPGCVNPDHLFVGTHKKNMEDKAQKGRVRGGKRYVACLTDSQARMIRQIYTTWNISQREIARRVGVSQRTINRAIHGVLATRSIAE